MRRLIMSRLIWIYAVCKSLLSSPMAVKELKKQKQKTPSKIDFLSDFERTVEKMQFMPLLYFQFLSLLGLICVSIPKDEGCAYLYGSTYSYFEFVTSSCMITCLIWYALYAFAITKKVGFVRWDIGVRLFLI